jgi:hypothetical protein
MLAWVAKPGSRDVWPVPAKFATAMMIDVCEIIQQSVQAANSRDDSETMKSIYEANAVGLSQWLHSKIDEYGVKALPMCTALLTYMPENRRGSVPEAKVNELRSFLAEKLRKEFVEGETPLLLVAGQHRLAFRELRETLRVHPQFSHFFGTLFRKLVEQANQDKTNRLKVAVVMALVGYECSIADDPPPESYTFNVDKAVIEKYYDLDLVVSALRRWAGLQLPDAVAQKAFDELKKTFSVTDLPRLTAVQKIGV